MPDWDSIAIIGVGLIGGSVGLAARDRGVARRVVGVGRNRANLELALARGAIDEAASSVESAVREADLVVICTPVERIAEHAFEAAANCPAGALITDAGSTKAGVVSAIDSKLAANVAGNVNGKNVGFVGSHPLAGGEKQGVAAAVSDLFVDRLAIVTPTGHSRASDVTAIERFWSLLGARVKRMSPDDHDRAVAAISHVPHLVAAALAAATPSADRALAASGWLDTTRVAAGDVELWRQIFSQNRRHVLASLTGVEQSLAEFREALEAEDDDRLTRLLEAGKNARDAVGG